jgi:PadR family transcriptional regulator, regulatory protein PadR
MTPARSEPSFESSLPLKPAETLILTMLTAGERHGYGIRQDILDHSEGRIELEAGGLYRHIRRLESGGYIESASGRRAAGEDPRRIHYKLTAVGRRVLAAEMLRMRELVRLAESRRIIAPARA